jgi:hypothetical protein
LSKLKLSADGGNFNKKIQALIEAGFVMELGNYGRSNRFPIYKYIDEYSGFYLHWVLPKKKTIERMKELRDQWQTIAKSGEYHAWRGSAFETICYQHVLAICKAAAVTQVNFMGSWHFSSKARDIESDAQIDLIFDRDDGTTTLCEIKCTDKPFVINKQYAENLRTKLKIFREKTETNKHLIFVLLSAHGLEENVYSKELINWCIDLEDIIKSC